MWTHYVTQLMGVVYTQSVTGVTHADDVNSYWVVKGKNAAEQCTRG